MQNVKKKETTNKQQLKCLRLEILGVTCICILSPGAAETTKKDKTKQLNCVLF